MIRLFAQMARDVANKDAALREVDRLNRTVEGIKFIVHETTVIATAELLGGPSPDPVPGALTQCAMPWPSMKRLWWTMSVAGSSSATRCLTGPHTPSDAQHPATGCPAPWFTAPKDVAKICDHDPDLLVELIRWNEEQEIAWRQGREETDDPEEERVCEIERKHAHRTVKLLRKALRLVLLGS